MKHNISITMDQKLFRELENVRGREKRSTFIEHLIVLGLRNYSAERASATVSTQTVMIPITPLHPLSKSRRS